MKKLLSILLISGLFSCGSGGDSSSGDNKQPDTGLSSNPDYQKGLELIAKSDCLTCHKVDEPLTGPKYRDVANKYAGMPDTIIGHLAGKIIHGGTGVWGQVYMTPHPTLSKEDAEAMVKYILLLKK